MLKKILLASAVVLIGIQFFQPKRNLSTRPSPNDLTTLHPPPEDVRHLLEVSCYDCHSDHTRYPWYAAISPINWWLASHVNDGKDHLNFSEFGTYTAKRAARKLQQCVDELDDHSMPLPSYKIVHTDARLTDAQVKALSDWFDSVRESIAPE